MSMGRRFTPISADIVSPSGVVEPTSEFFTAENAKTAEFFEFLSALCVLCGIIEPPFASNTQDRDYFRR
jgi:hypothetical protein